MLRFIQLIVLFVVFTNQTVCKYYWIREARPDDKGQIVELYKRSKGLYRGGLPDCGVAVVRSVSDLLFHSIDEGFAFVVESFDKGDKGRILGFLLKERSLHATHRHIIFGGLMVIDRDYLYQRLDFELYRHLLEQVSEYHSDILRIEAACHEFADDDITLFKECGFICCGRRELAVLLAGRRIADELLFVWWNKNFTPSHPFA